MELDQARELQAAIRALMRAGRLAVPPISGLPRSTVRLLGVVARRGEAGVRPGEIAVELGMTSSNVAASLRDLDTAGLIRRRRDPGDGRQVVVELTEAGRAAVAEHRSLRADALKESVDATLSAAEQAQLTAVIPLLERVATGHRR